MKPVLPQAGIFRKERQLSQQLFPVRKEVASALVWQGRMPVAITNISDSIFTGEVKSEEGRWQPEFCRLLEKAFLINHESSLGGDLMKYLKLLLLFGFVFLRRMYLLLPPKAPASIAMRR